MLHGAGICLPTFARTKSPSHVGKYTSTMVRIWVITYQLQCEAPKISKLVNITPMSLWFMVRK